VEQDLTLVEYIISAILVICLFMTTGGPNIWKKPKTPKWAQGVINGDVPYFYKFSETFGCVQRGEHYELLHWCPKSEGFRFQKSFKRMNEFPNNYCTSCEIQIPSKEKLFVMIKLQDLTSGPTGYLYEYYSDTN